MRRLFISHSWKYDDKFKGLKDLLDGNIDYYDHSVPKGDPIHGCGTDKELAEAIKAKMSGASCVLILAGVYSTYSKWINKEIEMAKEYGKPIIAIEYWGSERTSQVVKNNANKVVKWQSKSIVDAIKEVC